MKTASILCHVMIFETPLKIFDHFEQTPNTSSDRQQQDRIKDKEINPTQRIP
jgi:hypothetical protein